MQALSTIKLSEKQNQVFQNIADLKQFENSVSMLTEIIELHAESIGYELQSYYPKEKVSRLSVVPESIVFNNAGDIHLKLQYIIEEYNACSAVDTLKQENMKFTAAVDLENAKLHLKGEFWPEL